MNIGIEAIDLYMGQAYLELTDLFAARQLDDSRLDSLMMAQKSVSLPCEDAITNAVNAAKGIIDQLSECEKAQIQLLIVATESGIDFGKSISTYVHHYLELNRNCRLFEIKQACYGGTAALQMAVNSVAASPGQQLKALVIATDEARPAARMTYAEPSQGTAAVAMLVSNQPKVLAIDLGASGYSSYEVMDTCRPTAEVETGDPDLSLMSYLDCLGAAFDHYCDVVNDVDLMTSFGHMLFHVPFGGMVKGAHRKLLRQKTPLDRREIEADFQARVAPGLAYSMRVGNTYSASIYLALCSLLDNIELSDPQRVSLFSYGSGCASEFFTGVIAEQSAQAVAAKGFAARLNRRHRLTMAEYDQVLDLKKLLAFGVKDCQVDFARFGEVYQHSYAERGLLKLDAISGYHRKYSWS